MRYNRLKYTLKPKQGFSIYLLCLFVAILSWGSLKLSKEYQIQLTFKVKYVNTPINYIIDSNSDSLITITLKIKGYNAIANLRDFDNSALLFDASKLISANKTQTIISSENIIQALKNQKKIEIIESLFPNSIKVNYHVRARKKVPIRSLISHSTKNQFFVSDSIFFTPDSAWIYGAAADIENIHFVSTKLTHLSELDRLYIGRFSLKIRNIKKKQIEIVPSEITYFIPVERYTEATVNCKINKKINPEGNEVKTYPNTVKISYYVAISKFKNISDTSFLASIDFSNEIGKNKAHIKITKAPKNIKIIKINPEIVEYLNIKHD